MARHLLQCANMKSPIHDWVRFLCLAATCLVSSCAPEKGSDAPGANDPSSPESRLQCAGSEPSPKESLLLPVDLTDSAFSLFWPFHTSTPKGGVVFVSGVDGGLIEPGDGIYHSIAEELSHQGITSIFVRYRNPGDLEDSKIDALQGAKHLRMIGVKRMALVGWSFGGAVIAHAATQTPEAVTLIGFAPQAKDTDPIDDFTNRSLLLFHSRDDENIPFEASQQIMDSAPEHLKKRLVELSGYDHLLTGAGEEIRPIALEWLKSELNL